MMGVYIKGMTKKQAESCFKFAMDGWCVFELPEIVELPPHGRLIDADALAKMCQEMQSIEWNNKASPYSWSYAYESFEGDIDNAPTIIEAEEGEHGQL